LSKSAIGYTSIERNFALLAMILFGNRCVALIDQVVSPL